MGIVEPQRKQKIQGQFYLFYHEYCCFYITGVTNRSTAIDTSLFTAMDPNTQIRFLCQANAMA